MTAIKTETLYDEASDTLAIRRSIADVSPILDANAADRAAQPETGKYMNQGSHQIKVGRISTVDVERLALMGYDLLSPDPEVVRSALLYIQKNEPQWLTVNGTPFAKRMDGDSWR